VHDSRYKQQNTRYAGQEDHDQSYRPQQQIPALVFRFGRSYSQYCVQHAQHLKKKTHRILVPQKQQQF